MYDILYAIIDHVYVTGDQMQSYVLYGCICLIIVLSSVLLDLVYRVFRHLWRGAR